MLHLASPTRPTLTSPLFGPRSPSPRLSDHIVHGSVNLHSPPTFAPPPSSVYLAPPSSKYLRSLPALHTRPPLPSLFGLSSSRSPSPTVFEPDDFSTDDDSPLPPPLPLYNPRAYCPTTPELTTPVLKPSPSLSSECASPQSISPFYLTRSQAPSPTSASGRSSPFVHQETSREGTPTPYLDYESYLPATVSPSPSPTVTCENTPALVKLVDTPMNHADGMSLGESTHLMNPNAMERYEIQYTPERAARPRSRVGNVFLYILAIFLPPVPVFLKAGCGMDVLVNILLWALCWIPGVLHSMYIISSRP
ncbi:hypothetical protein CspHIS471_0601580 [Cutaneotrichosporon sp. HIS471]|nr:hypothetical protein CspHIS471_0601580 [Cutaneotrichosporon sp. HIS471]